MAPAERVRRICNFPARDRLCPGRERPHYLRLYTLTTPAYGHGSIPTADPAQEYGRRADMRLRANCSPRSPARKGIRPTSCSAPNWSCATPP